MKIKINGKEETVDKDSVSVAELLVINKVEQPDMVSVQLNAKFVKKENFGTTYLKEGDEIDFLYFMGGGKDLRFLDRYILDIKDVKDSIPTYKLCHTLCSITCVVIEGDSYG